jgi:hypothetical protein
LSRTLGGLNAAPVLLDRTFEMPLMKKLALIAALLLASSPVVAQSRQQALGAGGTTNNSLLPNTGIIVRFARSQTDLRGNENRTRRRKIFRTASCVTLEWRVIGHRTLLFCLTTTQPRLRSVAMALVHPAAA